MKTEVPGPSFLTVYFCGIEKCTPNHFFGPAIRPHYLIHVVLSGKGIYQHQGVTYHLGKGDAFLIPPMAVTYYQADSLDPWNYTWVGFDGKSCPDVLSQTVFADSCVFTGADEHTAQRLAENMELLRSSFSESPKNSLQTAGKLLLLLSCMPKELPLASISHAELYLQKAREFIENNYSYPIKITDIARYTGIDRTYLYRIFMEQEHLSPKQYLLRHRLRVATEILCSSDYSITEIALSCGFKDASAFSNYFRQNAGTTPRAFRKAVREER